MFSSPHQHLLGAKVTIESAVQEELKIDWSEGIIAATFETGRGIGVYVVNPETGKLTAGITLDALILDETAIGLLSTMGTMSANLLKQMSQMLEDFR